MLFRASCNGDVALLTWRARWVGLDWRLLWRVGPACAANAFATAQSSKPDRARGPEYEQQEHKS